MNLLRLKNRSGTTQTTFRVNKKYHLRMMVQLTSGTSKVQKNSRTPSHNPSLQQALTLRIIFLMMDRPSLHCRSINKYHQAVIFSSQNLKRLSKRSHSPPHKQKSKKSIRTHRWMNQQSKPKHSMISLQRPRSRKTKQPWQIMVLQPT